MASNDKGQARKRLPKYMEIAADIRQKIKTGEWPPDHVVPSAAALCDQYDVSMSVTKKALDLLKSEGHVYAVFGVATYVANRPRLVRISPERQVEGAETSFRNESNADAHIDRDTNQVVATSEVAEGLGLSLGDEITHTVTRASVDGQPVSISDTYQPLGLTDISGAAELEETIADELPSPAHAEWLNIAPGDQVKTIRQRFIAADGRVVMLSDVSYPRDRYDAFIFRMSLPVES
ncbi:GntR family transcriptional regulator [Actinocrispum sp. NPDC049592]|uniref:GntR family transcriptional regulator n=1 Tax=Actinocrispum sp. NPDC049592 TaxID=3154835 RepID=UPI0034126101